MADNEHGGTDALGVPAHDFSTNRNACGPCPEAVAALQSAHLAQYPDPHYTALRLQLAAFHAVAPERLVIGGSSSELIHRLTQHALRQGATKVSLPRHSYGDYAQAAQVWGLHTDARSPAWGEGLHWACEPSSPLGRVEDMWQALPADACHHGLVLDCAYRPLWLEGPAPQRDMAALWQLWTPNKALGMTGVRAAYAIAPERTTQAQIDALRALAPSWVVGAHGVAMLQAWVTPEVQAWLARSLDTLRHWKARQLALCERLGWAVLPGHQANYFVARLPRDPADLPARLASLRSQGIKLRDARSFGLPGHVRLGVMAPVAQASLERAWLSLSDT